MENGEQKKESVWDGTRPTRLRWDELKRFIEVEKKLDQLGRLPEDLQVYLARVAELKREYKTVGDFVLCREFGLTSEIDESDGKRFVPSSAIEERRSRTSSNSVLEEDYTFVPNDFPYAVDKDIEHHLLWSLHELDEAQVAQIVAKERPAHLYETICCVNPTHLKSVLNVFHAHIFSRRTLSPSSSVQRHNTTEAPYTL
ncbi:hypothetical protein QOT17_023895 [Balamuthia mandrillaris]